MRALSRKLMVAACTGLLMLTAAPSSSTALEPSARIYAVISFVKPSIASKISDVSMGDLGPERYDKVSLSTDGTVYASGKGGDVRGLGQPSVIKINNTRDSIVNFVPTNYRHGNGIGSMQAQCSLQASGGSNCTGSPVNGGMVRTLYIGMDMTLADSVGLQPEGKNQPSFDMSIVYQ